MMSQTASDTFHIGHVASRVGLSLRTVRHYETLGLVTPSGRTDGGFRLYTEPDVQRLLLVRALKPAELSLDELHAVLELHDRVVAGDADDEARARLQRIVDHTAERLQLQRERIIAAELALEQLRRSSGLDPQRRGAA